MEKFNTEIVRVPSIENLIMHLTLVNPSNISQIAKLVEDLTAYLISFDTQADNIWNLMRFGDTVRQLLAPLIEEKYISVTETSAFSEQLHYPFFFIGSPNDDDDIRKIIKESRKPKEEKDVVSLKQAVIHVHSDVVNYAKPYGTKRTRLIPNENPLQNILLGRGVVDMKGQIATMIVVLYLLHYLNEKPPLILLSSDEEQGSLGGKNIFETVSAANLAIDLEPSLPDYYANEIFPSSYLTIQIKRNFIVKNTPLLPLELREHILSILRRTFDPKKYEFILNDNNEVNKITISIVDCNFRPVGDLSEELCQEILQVVSRQYKVKEAYKGTTDELQSDLTTDKKILLENVFQRRSSLSAPRLNDVMTHTGPIGDGSRRAAIRHNFETALSVFLYSRWDNLLIFGPREIGRRHSGEEAGTTGDFVLLAKNIVEVLCGGREIFIEA